MLYCRPKISHKLVIQPYIYTNKTHHIIYLSTDEYQTFKTLLTASSSNNKNMVT